MTLAGRNVRLPAEWESDGGILLSWPHAGTDWAYMLDEVTDCFTRIAGAIATYTHVIIVAPDTGIPKRCLASLDQSRFTFLTMDTDDTWARDFGPITTLREDGAAVINDFKFNGWGLKFKAAHDNLITGRMVACGALRGEYANRLGFVLEGGSIESDGRGHLLTTKQCLLSKNRNGNMSQQQIESYLSRALGVEKILWLDHGALSGDDTDSHIDTLARFAPDNTIVYTCTGDTADSHFPELREMEKQLEGFTTIDGIPFNLVRLPLPDPVYDENGERLPATYANFLVLKDAVLLPVYGQPQKDLPAVRALETAFPGHEIVRVDCRALIRQHGSLHCVTMQLPKAILPI